MALRNRWLFPSDAETGTLYEGRFADALSSWEEEPVYVDDDGRWWKVVDSAMPKRMPRPKRIRYA